MRLVANHEHRSVALPVEESNHSSAAHLALRTRSCGSSHTLGSHIRTQVQLLCLSAILKVQHIVLSPALTLGHEYIPSIFHSLNVPIFATLTKRRGMFVKRCSANLLPTLPNVIQVAC